jgi:HD-GYP domain-containing protein (c-di-GMP phosphodiesterase class II)
MEVSRSHAFWLSLEREHISGYVASWIGHDTTKEMDFQDLKSIAQIFSHIVDAKSSFTKEHSEGVASLSRYLGELFVLSEHTCDMLEIAGLLHDLGKLRVPDQLLEKQGKLTREEYLIMQRHSFDTYDILKNIKGFEEIAQWAAQHHERVDGSG